MEKAVVLGVIGGSGIYDIDHVTLVNEHKIKTPFGEPSDVIVEASYQERPLFFLPRHGRGHKFLPSEVNYRANIFALKSLGVTHILAVSAVGIMREDINMGDFIVPDQLFDRTRGHRPDTFFGDGIVAHVEFSDPFSDEIRQWILKAGKSLNYPIYDGGTLVVIEGPQFSTRAESIFYRNTLKPSCIGMTALPEARLAREAEIAYAILGRATDYDCWNDQVDHVTTEMVIETLKKNTAKAKRLLIEILDHLPEFSSDPSLTSVQNAIMTAQEAIPQEQKEKLRPILGHYF